MFLSGGNELSSIFHSFRKYVYSFKHRAPYNGNINFNGVSYCADLIRFGRGWALLQVYSQNVCDTSPHEKPKVHIPLTRGSSGEVLLCSKFRKCTQILPKTKKKEFYACRYMCVYFSLEKKKRKKTKVMAILVINTVSYWLKYE